MGKIADLSYYQGDIDFKKAKTELDLAIIRVQYGSRVIDKKYKEYVEGCKANSIPFSHYAYAKYVNVADAKQEAVDFLSRVDKEAKFLVVDVEQQTCTNKNDLVPATQMFIDTCKQAGWKVGLYSGEYFYQSNGLDKVKADFLWIAKYSVKAPVVPYDLWQYSDIGRVAGIDGNVDLNKLGNKSLEWFIGTTPKPEPPKPTPQSNLKTYIIQSGDSLSKIALKFGVSLDRLASFNGIKNPNLIYKGQKVVIPHDAPKPSPQPVVQTHIVKSGDTVSELAAKYGSSISQIQSWNHLDSHYTIYVGQKLRVK